MPWGSPGIRCGIISLKPSTHSQPKLPAAESADLPMRGFLSPAPYSPLICYPASRIRVHGAPRSVRYEKEGKRHPKQVPPFLRNFSIYPLIPGQHKADQKRTARAKSHCSQKAYPPVDVQKVPAVIPPSKPPLIFQKHTADIFQDAAYQCRIKKYLHRLFL